MGVVYGSIVRKKLQIDKIIYYLIIAGSDFVHLSTLVNLQTDSNQCRTIFIREDNIVELSETFQVSISSDHAAVNIVGVTATITITDTTREWNLHFQFTELKIIIVYCRNSIHPNSASIINP